MLNALTLKQLRSLKMIAETGSITEAAAEQMLSPPAVHSQIKKLDEILNARVLTRDADRNALVPTPQGDVLISAAARIEGILAWVRDNLTALETGSAGHVRIGFESTGRYFAPRLISLIKTACPTIDIAFDVANRSHISESLQQQRIDLAVMGRPPRDPEIEAVPLAPHPYGIYVPPDHDLAKRADYDPELLLRQTILAREPGSGTRILLERFLDQIEGYGTASMIELDSNETIKEAVASGLGVAMLSRHVVQRELKDGRLVELAWPRLPVMRYWYLVSQNHTDAPESTQRVRQVIIDANGAFIGA